MITLIGLNHKTAPLAVREKLFAGCQEENNLLSELVAMDGVREAMYLSTCNRIEVLACVDGQSDTVQKLCDLLTKNGGLTQKESTDCIYAYCDEEAVRHLFRVASSLDSQVMGETQILGQVKNAYRQALEKNFTGVVINRLLHRAFRTAKRVRSETAIAVNPVSVSFAAVTLAKKIFGSLTGKKVLLIGAGEMAELTGMHLVTSGVAEIIIANRSPGQALTLAEKFHGRALSLDALEEALIEADIVISSTGAPSYVVSADLIRQIHHKRKNRLLFLIDVAVPRDVDPLSGNVENVYLYNIDNLQDIVDENMDVRKKEACKAETIVEEEVKRYVDWVCELEAVPTIVLLRSKVEGIVQVEMAKAKPWLKELNAGDQQKVEILVNSIVNKLLHHPVTALKEESSEFDSANIAALTRQLFHLDE
ncbi:MAG: glutamyl-tRNA reductase [Smithellaceae bacterium]